MERKYQEGTSPNLEEVVDICDEGEEEEEEDFKQVRRGSLWVCGDDTNQLKPIKNIRGCIWKICTAKRRSWCARGRGRGSRRILRKGSLQMSIDLLRTSRISEHPYTVLKRRRRRRRRWRGRGRRWRGRSQCNISF